MPTRKYKVETGEEENPLYFGIEIEGSLSYSSAIESRIVAAAGNNRYNSGTDGGGFEVALQPATLKYLRDTDVLDRVLAAYDQSNARMDTSTQAGIHIHIGKEYFTGVDFLAMWKLICDNKEHFTLLFRRTASHSYGYQGKPMFFSSQLNGTRESMDKHVDHIEKCLRGSASYTNDSNNFQINRKSVPTIEFRLFQSTSSKAVILAYVELLHSVYHYVKTTTEPITFIRYKNYLLGNAATYKEVIQLIKDYKIPIKTRSLKPIDPKVIKRLVQAKKKKAVKKFNETARKRILQPV